MRGKVVGIDLYTWLHKDLVGLGHGPGNDQMEEVVKCTLARARRLAQAGIQAVFCVEGDLLPGKADTAEGRTHVRAAAMEALFALYEEGDELGNELLEGAVVTREESEQMFEQLRKLRSAAACITVDMLYLLLRKLRWTPSTHQIGH